MLPRATERVKHINMRAVMLRMRATRCGARVRARSALPRFFYYYAQRFRVILRACHARYVTLPLHSVSSRQRAPPAKHTRDRLQDAPERVAPMSLDAAAYATLRSMRDARYVMKQAMASTAIAVMMSATHIRQAPARAGRRAMRGVETRNRRPQAMAMRRRQAIEPSRPNVSIYNVTAPRVRSMRSNGRREANGL